MITVRLATPSDYPACDRFIDQHPEASPYHYTAWLKSIEQSYQHQSFYFIAEEKNNIIGLLPLVKIKSLFLSSTLCSLPFCDVAGILANNKEAKELLLSTSKGLAAKKTNHSLSLRNSASTTNEHKKGFPAGTKVRMIFPLPESSETLLASFKPKLRSQIKKATKNGVSYSQTNTPEALNAFYIIMQLNMQRLGSPFHSKQWFESIMAHYGKKAQIGLVHYDNKVVGAAIILLCGKTVTVPWASTLSEYNKFAPNMALYWGLLSYASDNHFKSFDFGRSTIGEGTYRFKKQWGAKPYPLDWQDFNIEGLIEKKSNRPTPSKLKPTIIILWSKLPPIIANTLGPKLRKYISL